MFSVPVNRRADLERMRADIDRLAAGLPMRGTAWLASWWDAYSEVAGGDRFMELASLAVYDPHQQARMIGFAPLYRSYSRQQGNTLRWIGSGEVYSDYLTLLAEPSRRIEVVDTTARWLAEGAARQWDTIELEGVPRDDETVQTLVQRLGQQGHCVYFRNEAAGWQIPLPDDWEAYVERLSKSHRKQVRRAMRNWFDSGECRLHVAETPDELTAGFDIFRALHIQRRRHLRQAACFDSPRFARFFQLSAQQLYAAEQLQLMWLTLAGTPIAADFNLLGGETLYAYQGGFDPRTAEIRPGWLLTLATVRLAIERGWKTYDFLRGNEPYKVHLRAEPRPMVHYRIVSRDASRGLRHGLWRTGQRAKGLATGVLYPSWQPWTEGSIA